ncbi:SIS domain-containing protein [Patescibacteria group bacterium]|nr:SIS domain-containing protein [Patescibacteria group bacterium]
MDKEKIPNLDESVVAALKFFIKENPKFPNKLFSALPIIVGSGNAYNAGRVIFRNQAGFFANESNFKKILKDYQSLIKTGLIKEALIISASGEKDSVWEIKLAKKFVLKTILFTCQPNSSAAKIADQVFIFKKLREPYTYNVSTYLAMILAAEKAQAKKILLTLKNLPFPKDFANYKAYSFILPDEFIDIAPMLEIKRHELFGPRLSIRAFSQGEARHAKFVIPWDKELIISFGENKFFGAKKQRWEIKIEKQTKAALIMALSYFIIGKIQETKAPYFKNNIKDYCNNGAIAYGKTKPFSVMVD